MKTEVDCVVSQDLLAGITSLIQRVTGIPVEYVSVTYKLLDRNPEATVYKTKIHDRPLVAKHKREFSPEEIQ